MTIQQTTPLRVDHISWHIVAAPPASASPTKLFLGCALWGIAALLLFGSGIGRTTNLIFDEPNYLPIARALIHGNLPPLQMNSAPGRQHPPLGSYLIAAGMKIAGDRPLGWRLAGVVCGSLILSAMFLWTFLLLRDFRLAMLAAALTLLNNFLYVMSRVAMLDIFEFMFVMWGLVAFTAAATGESGIPARRTYLLLSGVLLGFAGACKWNAIDALLVLLMISLAVVTSPRWRNPFAQAAADNLRATGLPVLFLSLTVVPALAYLSTFVAYFHATHMPFSLSGVIDMHWTMFRLTRVAQGNICLYVPWYRWPVNLSPMPGFSYLMGNVVVMLAGLFALGVCVYRWWRDAALADALVVLLYAANLLQWSVTPLKVLNYYYYFSAAMFLGPAIAFALRGPTPPRIFGIRLSVLVTIGAAAFFLHCYPRMANLQAPWDCFLGCAD